jgi:predicted small secreted protein
MKIRQENVLVKIFFLITIIALCVFTLLYTYTKRVERVSRIYELLKKYVPREKDEITGLWSLNAGTPFSSVKSYLILHDTGIFEIHNPTKRVDEWFHNYSREKIWLKIKTVESQKCKRIIIGNWIYSTKFVQWYGNNQYNCTYIDLEGGESYLTTMGDETSTLLLGFLGDPDARRRFIAERISSSEICPCCGKTFDIVPNK